MSNKKEFYIPRIEENAKNNFESKSNSSSSPFEKFASSYSGYNVKDKTVFPYVKYSNNGAQYEDLKDKQYQKKYEDYKASTMSPKDKYSPDRIPSYLRREEPAITRRNIMDLKGERPTEKELYQKNRENYGRYSDESGLNDEGKTISQGIVFQETYQSNPAQVVVNQVKPSREERSTLVITKREPERAAHFNNPYENNVASNRQEYQASRNEVRYESRRNDDNRYDSRYQDSRINEENNYESRYQDIRRTDTTQYEQRYQENNYERQDRYSSYREEQLDVKYEEAKNNRYQERYDDRKETYKPIDNKSFLTTVEDESDHFYDDIDIPLQSIKNEEHRELDSYQMENTPKVVEVNKAPSKPKRSKKYKFPPVDILERSKSNPIGDGSETDFQRTTIDSTLEEFKIGGHVVNEIKGPTVTQFEIKLDPGVKVEKVEGIARNLQMNLESSSIRIEAPIPGKSTVGIEVPNATKSKVTFGDLATKSYLNDGKPLNVILGKRINGEGLYTDISDMPHALVAGSTGSGKTVCIHSIITSILYKATPEEVKLILVDPKRNELMYFDSVPHLASPIIDDPKLAAPALKWAVDEMERRYELFRLARKRTIDEYNEYAEKTMDPSVSRVPYIVIVIDEFADLMTSAGDSFEASVQRLTQKARSAGIHMIIATQRPSVDVIKGTIKGNIQARIAFRVTMQTDSFTILDRSGAEKLLGKGDMLFTKGGPSYRVQGAFISTDEIEEVVSYINSNGDIDYMFTLEDLQSESETNEMVSDDETQDELLPKVAKHVVVNRKASVNQICRLFGIGFNRADNLMYSLEQMGIVGPAIQGRPRTVLVNEEELERILNNM